MREINSARTIAPGFFSQSRRRYAVQGRASGNEGALIGGIFDGPGFATVETACEQIFLRSFAINIVAFAEVLVITAAEAHQNLVAPRPEAVIGRPAAKAAR